MPELTEQDALNIAEEYYAKTFKPAKMDSQLLMKCPFTKLPVICGRKDCEGCEIRIASVARVNQVSAKNMDSIRKHQRSGAKK